MPIDYCLSASDSDSGSSYTAAIIGGVVAVVFMIITALTVIAIVVLVLRSRSGNFTTEKTR